MHPLSKKQMILGQSAVLCEVTVYQGLEEIVAGGFLGHEDLLLTPAGLYI